jgi:flagellar FliL protein
MSDKKPEAAPAADKGDAHGAAAAGGGGGGGMKAMMPAIIAIVMAPAATWAVANFVLLPKFKESVAVAVAASDSAGGDGHGEKKAKPEAHGEKKPDAHGAKKPDAHGAKKADAHGGKKGDAGAGEGYKFENVVVNLSGTMGTRYLKASFLITGDKPDLAERFAESKPQLTDVTLAVLSSLTLADLEEAGSKNIIRERLLASYNQALGAKVAENLYFSEFVVQ